MRVLWFAWKDAAHPWAGGAEVVGQELMRRLAADGHEVRLVTAAFAGGQGEAVVDGVAITRLGNRWSVYWRACRLYRRRLAGWADLVIDEMNTLPFFCRLYVREPSLMMVHQLCREVWLYQMRFPLNVIGYLAEPLYLWALRGARVITVSGSTKDDLTRFGFRRERITVVPQGIAGKPLPSLAGVAKDGAPTLLAFGSVRAMKRTHAAVLAFNRARASWPGLRLVIAGEMGKTGYPGRVRRLVAASPYAADISIMESVTAEEKLLLMRRAHLIVATSVKEGWGLTVSEAAGQGTPAVAFDVDGLRDSVRHGETGLLVPDGDLDALANAIVDLLGDRDRYERLRRRGWEEARAMTFDRTYQSFLAALQGRGPSC